MSIFDKTRTILTELTVIWNKQKSIFYFQIDNYKDATMLKLQPNKYSF